MKRLPTSILLIATMLALLTALYCFSGYAMNASFSVASDNARFAEIAVIWGSAGLASLSLAIGLGVAVWRRFRKESRLLSESARAYQRKRP